MYYRGCRYPGGVAVLIHPCWTLSKALNSCRHTKWPCFCPITPLYMPQLSWMCLLKTCLFDPPYDMSSVTCRDMSRHLVTFDWYVSWKVKTSAMYWRHVATCWRHIQLSAPEWSAISQIWSIHQVPWGRKNMDGGVLVLYQSCHILIRSIVRY